MALQLVPGVGTAEPLCHHVNGRLQAVAAQNREGILGHLRVSIIERQQDGLARKWLTSPPRLKPMRGPYRLVPAPHQPTHLALKLVRCNGQAERILDRQRADIVVEKYRQSMRPNAAQTIPQRAHWMLYPPNRSAVPILSDVAYDNESLFLRWTKDCVVFPPRIHISSAPPEPHRPRRWNRTVPCEVLGIPWIGNPTPTPHPPSVQGPGREAKRYPPFKLGQK